MLTAIIVIVLMASVAMFVMNISGKIVKSTTTQYQHEQAILYAKSYTEYAILAVTGNDRTANCLTAINGTIGDNPAAGNGYQVRVKIAYIVDNANQGACAAIRLNAADLNTSSAPHSTPLNIVVDVFVDYKDPDDTAGPFRTVHRRTIQKI